MTEPVRVEYWDKEIQPWSRSSYTGKRQNFMERLRSSIDARKNTALDLIATHCPKDTVLMDLGCGVGAFGLEALQKGIIAKTYGVDFAHSGIQQAREDAQRLGFADKAFFETGGALDCVIPDDVTLITGLGLMDWLHDHENRQLYGRLKGRRFIISFSEQDGSFAEIVHRLWLCERLRLFGKGVRAYHHKREFALGLARDVAGARNPEIVKKKEARFGVLIHNLMDFPVAPREQ